MSFDIATLDVVTPSEAGAVMEVINIATGQPALDSDGKPVTITLRGMLSPTMEAMQRKIAERRMEMIRRDEEVTPEMLEADTAELFAAATIGWSFDKLDEQPFPCTPENAKRFWADPRFTPIRNQADKFVAKVANFTKA